MVLEIFWGGWLLSFAWVLYVCLVLGGFSITMNLLKILFYFIAIAGLNETGARLKVPRADIILVQMNRKQA